MKKSCVRRIRRLMFVLIPVVLTISCATPYGPITRDEWGGITTRQFSGKTPAEVADAAARVMELADPGTVHVAYSADGMVARRPYSVNPVPASGVHRVLCFRPPGQSRPPQNGRGTSHHQGRLVQGGRLGRNGAGAGEKCPAHRHSRCLRPLLQAACKPAVRQALGHVQRSRVFCSVRRSSVPSVPGGRRSHPLSGGTQGSTRRRRPCSGTVTPGRLHFAPSVPVESIPLKETREVQGHDRRIHAFY